MYILLFMQRITHGTASGTLGALASINNSGGHDPSTRLSPPLLKVTWQIATFAEDVSTAATMSPESPRVIHRDQGTQQPREVSAARYFNRRVSATPREWG